MIHPTEPLRRNNTAPEQPNNRKQSLEKSVNRLAKWLHLFTGLVAFGLILEYAPDIVEAFRTRQIPSRLLTGGILITVGVAGELFVGFFASRKDTALREENDSLIAKAHERAALAEQSAAEANLARVRIEEQLFKPHVLTDDARNELIEILKEYSGRKRVDVFVYDSHLSGVLELAHSMDGVFSSAQWKSKLWIGAEPRIMGAEAAFTIAKECPFGTGENIALQHLADRLSGVLLKLDIGCCTSVGSFSTESSKLPSKPLAGWGIWDFKDVAIFRVQIGQRQLTWPVTPPQA